MRNHSWTRESRRIFIVLGTVVVAVTLVAFILVESGRSAPAETASARSRALQQTLPPPHLGYGFNVAGLDLHLINSLGFDWIKVFSPPPRRLEQNVLLRLTVSAADLNDLRWLRTRVRRVARDYGTYIDAYELGNEPNLNALYGWNAPPVAADYARLLCAVYPAIHAEDDNATVVSAGLAPAGRIDGNWNGHKGHNGFAQDEREWLIEFLEAGGGDCLDALGYHPYGFSADYDTLPDQVDPENPDANCENGFCFRGVEKIYEILVNSGLGNTMIWATEFGWIVDPTEEGNESCLATAPWSGRAWQIVNEEEQARNLVGAFRYADENMPWMGPMFVFNLNFNTAAYPPCEQMRYFGIEGRPAEQALRDLEKRPRAPAARLGVEGPPPIIRKVEAQPLSYTPSLVIKNSGNDSLNYTVTVKAPAFTLTISDPHGELQPAQEVILPLTLIADGLSSGHYLGTLTVDASHGTQAAPQNVTVDVYLWDSIHHSFLPTTRTDWPAVGK